jgi:hypothetical protein
MFCIDCIDTSDIFIGAGVIATLAGVGVALFLGVGGWRRETRIRKAERAESQRIFATLLAHDVRRLQIQGRDVRKFLEEARFGPPEDDEGRPINVFCNPFAAQHNALMMLSRISIMERSVEWAKYLPHHEVKIACALTTYVDGWNEKAQLLQEFPENTTLPADLSDDLVLRLFTVLCGLTDSDRLLASPDSSPVSCTTASSTARFSEFRPRGRFPRWKLTCPAPA